MFTHKILALVLAALTFNLSVTQLTRAGTFANTGSMTSARFAHTATLLPNAKVLVAGGFDSTDGTTAELYDPATGVWTNTGSMAVAHRYHTATLLPNGKVLVAGGESTTNVCCDPDFCELGTCPTDYATPIAELYDPASGTWTNTGLMTTARWQHEATLLSNGMVLVEGGIYDDLLGNSLTLYSAELYNPASGIWSATGAMSTNRYQQTATLLPNGNVLVAGGIGPSGYDHVFTSEEYEPLSGIWTSLRAMTIPRAAHTATLLANGKVLVAGGTPDGGYNFVASAELYDPSAKTWTSTGSMSQVREKHSATLLPSGKVLVAAGYDHGELNGAELYDPVSGVWTNTGSLNVARAWHPATLLPNGKVLVEGGLGSVDITATAELYDPRVGETALTGCSILTNGSFRLTFKSSAGASFDVLASTNLALPLTNWTVLSGVTEVSPGQYQFTDPQATNYLQRYYRLGW